jgi:hypothetical protein
MEPFSVLHSRYGGLEERIARGGRGGGGGPPRPPRPPGLPAAGVTPPGRPRPTEVPADWVSSPGPPKVASNVSTNVTWGGGRQCRTAGFSEGGARPHCKLQKGPSSNTALNASESEAPKHCRFGKRGTDTLATPVQSC